MNFLPGMYYFSRLRKVLLVFVWRRRPLERLLYAALYRSDVDCRHQNFWSHKSTLSLSFEWSWPEHVNGGALRLTCNAPCLKTRLGHSRAQTIIDGCAMLECAAGRMHATSSPRVFVLIGFKVRHSSPDSSSDLWRWTLRILLPIMKSVDRVATSHMAYFTLTLNTCSTLFAKPTRLIS